MRAQPEGSQFIDEGYVDGAPGLPFPSICPATGDRTILIHSVNDKVP